MIIAVTDRNICARPFFEQLELVLAGRPDVLILREKDLPEKIYLKLAKQALGMCREHSVMLCINSFFGAADKLGIEHLQLPMPLLREYSGGMGGMELWASVHSPEEAAEAVELGADRLVFGNVFSTGCKPGKPAAGIGMLETVCISSDVPVYAIGGINSQNAGAVMKAGAKGICAMSSLMEAENPAAVIDALRNGMKI